MILYRPILRDFLIEDRENSSTSKETAGMQQNGTHPDLDPSAGGPAWVGSCQDTPLSWSGLERNH